RALGAVDWRAPRAERERGRHRSPRGTHRHRALARWRDAVRGGQAEDLGAFEDASFDALESRLELVELHITQHVSRHESGEAFVDLAEASSFGNFLRIVPEELRASLRADLVSGFDAQRGPDGVVVRGWGVLFVARRTLTTPPPGV